ncbi:Ribonuclease D [Corynebacterium ciconiae DSM 44920]|uniref:HRDC domain-containing protein n=1 Tax=Corynebacterium ciconiae TaxID=227319 RepID=UPI00035C6F92|nr:HRDC domain-containing protein [Corynebacterium ciconiae]WKD61359.1 Ribonuclease D [Corynebacterium ciconiae DSM 44920]
MQLDEPRDGLPPVYSTPTEFQHAAAALAAGHGPIAVDTERAQTYRFDDRIFLLQLRRAGSGSFLIAPERHRRELPRILAPVLNPETWILHSAHNDLPMLRALGIYPSGLIDTEIASRLLGVDKPNLSNSLQHFLGISLAKGHGRENWSRWPLPSSWLNYAALDVELLIELAEAQAALLEQENKSSWMAQECAHLLALCDVDAPEPSWTGVKGVGTIRSRKQLAFMRELWAGRRTVARKHDLPPFKVLPNPLLLELARRQPRSKKELKDAVQPQRRLKDVPSRVRAELLDELSMALGRARAMRKETWPQRPGENQRSGDYGVKSSDPLYKASLQAVREDLEDLGESLHLDRGLLIDARAMKKIVAHSVNVGPLDDAELDADYQRFDVRPWQQELTRTIFHRHLQASSNY